MLESIFLPDWTRFFAVSMAKSLISLDVSRGVVALRVFGVWFVADSWSGGVCSLTMKTWSPKRSLRKSSEREQARFFFLKPRKYQFFRRFYISINQFLGSFGWTQKTKRSRFVEKRNKFRKENRLKCFQGLSEFSGYFIWISWRSPCLYRLGQPVR